MRAAVSFRVLLMMPSIESSPESSPLSSSHAASLHFFEGISSVERAGGRGSTSVEGTEDLGSTSVEGAEG